MFHPVDKWTIFYPHSSNSLQRIIFISHQIEGRTYSSLDFVYFEKDCQRSSHGVLYFGLPVFNLEWLLSPKMTFCVQSFVAFYKQNLLVLKELNAIFVMSMTSFVFYSVVEYKLVFFFFKWLNEPLAALRFPPEKEDNAIFIFFGYFGYKSNCSLLICFKTKLNSKIEFIKKVSGY